MRAPIEAGANQENDEGVLVERGGHSLAEDGRHKGPFSGEAGEQCSLERQNTLQIARKTGA
jgi:hypothetical protein